MQNNQTQEEMVGVLTAISVVSKRLAKQLLELERGDRQNDNDEEADNSKSRG